MSNDSLSTTWAAAEVDSTIPLVTLAQTFFSILTYFRGPLNGYPKSARVFDGQSFDFIIVGGGSAGCTLANRLTEVPHWNVLLIEAGEDPDYTAEIPGLFLMADYPKIDWNYYSIDDNVTSQAHKSKTVRITRGKMLSGSSGTNFMAYVRGVKADYEKWVDLGNDDWDWKTVLRYFKKLERLDDVAIMNSKSEKLYGYNGNVKLTVPDVRDKIKNYIQSFQELGHKYLLDYNGYEQLGYSSAMVTLDNGVRQSTGEAYLKPAANRPNLFVLKNTLCRKVIIENKKAVGVEVQSADRGIYSIRASKEVILSAGAINSPQLLLLSGIGPKKHLEEMGIKVILNSPNVGKNMKDHVTSPVAFTDKKGIQSSVQNINLITGLLSYPTTIIGFVSLDKSKSLADYQALAYPLPATAWNTPLFCSYVLKLDNDICIALVKAGLKRQTVFSYIPLLHPESSGEVKLNSKNPEDAPRIYTGFYSNPNDLEKHARCMEDYVKVVNTTYFKSVESEIIDMKIPQCRHLVLWTHEYWKCYLLNTANTLYHQCGTCTMGPEGKGVVDQRLKLRGIENLRIIDASVWPDIVSGNINGPVIMTAEKGADMIKKDYGIKCD